MTTTITINNKTYNIPKIGFGEMCELEDMGVDFSGRTELKPMHEALILMQFVMKCDKETCIKEINEHMHNNKGSLIELIQPINDMIYSSDFFQEVDATQEENK